MKPADVIRTAGIGRHTLYGMPEGFDALGLADTVQATKGVWVHVALDDRALDRLQRQLETVAPALSVLAFPAWDTAPYDRVSPKAALMGQRMATLSALVQNQGPALVLTTVNGLLQRTVPQAAMAMRVMTVQKGQRLNQAALLDVLVRNGYARAETVMEPGEFAVRGGLIDVFPPGGEEPYRLDLFGDEVDRMRRFDPMSQKSRGDADHFAIGPVSEAFLDPESVEHFRRGYRALAGAQGASDALFEQVSRGVRSPGMEHWLPLFFPALDTLLAYVPETAPLSLDPAAEEAVIARWAQITDHYEARTSLGAHASAGEDRYVPVPPERLFVTEQEFTALLEARSTWTLSPFAPADTLAGAVDQGGRPGRSFADIRALEGVPLFDAVRDALAAAIGQGKRALVTAESPSAQHRLAGLLRDHGVDRLAVAEDWSKALSGDPTTVHVVTAPFTTPFETDALYVLTEAAILGDRLARAARQRRRKAEDVIGDVTALETGDLVVHVDHGIGRYEALETLTVGTAPHDCLRVVYADGDKLFVPVENIDVLSRYGSETEGVTLDRLGGTAWQARKAKLKERIRDMAEGLIKIAAARETRRADPLVAPPGMFDEFAARFPYEETEDQLQAIAETLEDMAGSKPMDRLICGDVGFGKTEVALRAAFAAATAGVQVAVVVPTTLLARQHFNTFEARFQGFPFRVAQLSRFVTPKEAKAVRHALADGTINVVVGTHALLAKGIQFCNLGLLVIDEEQHFGVAHKERLKALRAEVHVLTLSATPIPRTLQMALSGVRDLTIMATPPPDRLAVRTFVTPFDSVVLREAILRERLRGGQVFAVVPRIGDMREMEEKLSALVPEARLVTAHGKLASRDLEDIMEAFAAGKYDILLSTSIIESGLDLPNVNTMIVHRAHMFGLSQLYQLRGRVGRGKERGYAYLTTPARKKLTAAAEKRLHVMQSLDTLGAGFSIASHDMDIRGAGNLLGDEQSGHVKEVGVELYQHLLEEAVMAARATEAEETPADRDWSPQINLGMPVLLPEDYVADLGLRLGLYRRIGALADLAAVEDMADELVDRFGPLPQPAANLLMSVRLKILCRQACVERLEAGPKGAVLSFRDNSFPNPSGLVSFIAGQAGTVRLRPDHKLVVQRVWATVAQKTDGAMDLLGALASLAQDTKKAA